tara:strand:- start:10957 stop:11859 length:903 start_codon:yes stop_codon:yes gene_type:complete
MQITFLGTGSMLPTKDRNPIGIAFDYKSEHFLFDCGEGTQRQMKLAGLSPAKITTILLSHLHGDHVFGLPGLLLTMGHANYKNQITKKLQIYGPKNTKTYYKKMRDLYVKQTSIDIQVKEVSKGVIYETKDFKIEVLPLDHTTPVVGYSFIEKDKRKMNMTYLKKYGLQKNPILKKLQEGKNIKWKGKTIKAKEATKVIKGKKITLVTDTGVCTNIIKLAKNADVLICEATLLDELREKSKAWKHLTAKQAGQLAKKAQVKKLILMHFSQRYNSTTPLLKEAKKYFKNTICAKDFYVHKL